jgi:hypothetical protein
MSLIYRHIFTVPSHRYCAVIFLLCCHIVTVPSYCYCVVIFLLCCHNVTVPSYCYCAVMSLMYRHIFTVPSHRYCAVIFLLCRHIFTVLSYCYCAIILLLCRHVVNVPPYFYCPVAPLLCRHFFIVPPYCYCAVILFMTCQRQLSARSECRVGVMKTLGHKKTCYTLGTSTHSRVQPHQPDFLDERFIPCVRQNTICQFSLVGYSNTVNNNGLIDVKTYKGLCAISFYFVWQ